MFNLARQIMSFSHISVVSMTMPRTNDDPHANAPYRTPHSVNHNFYGPVHNYHHSGSQAHNGDPHRHVHGDGPGPRGEMGRRMEKKSGCRCHGENKANLPKMVERGACPCKGHSREATSRLWRFQIGDNFGPYEYM